MNTLSHTQYISAGMVDRPKIIVMQSESVKSQWLCIGTAGPSTGSAALRLLPRVAGLSGSGLIHGKNDGMPLKVGWMQLW
jgi:hypothetical protein